MKLDQASARGFVLCLAVPIIHGKMIEQIVVAEDGEDAAEDALEQTIGRRTPWNRRIAGFDPPEIELPDAVADHGDGGRTVVNMLEDTDTQVGKLDGLQDFEHGSAKGPFNAPAGLRPAASDRGCFARCNPAANQLVMRRERGIEEGGDIPRQRDLSPREINRGAEAGGRRAR